MTSKYTSIIFKRNFAYVLSKFQKSIPDREKGGVSKKPDSSLLLLILMFFAASAKDYLRTVIKDYILLTIDSVKFCLGFLQKHSQIKASVKLN